MKDNLLHLCEGDPAHYKAVCGAIDVTLLDMSDDARIRVTCPKCKLYFEASLVVGVCERLDTISMQLDVIINYLRNFWMDKQQGKL